MRKILAKPKFSNFFGFFGCNITKITQNECFPGLSGKYEAAGNRLINFDL